MMNLCVLLYKLVLNNDNARYVFMLRIFEFEFRDLEACRQ